MAEITKPNFSNALWASGGSIVAPSDVKIATGWTAEVPPFQWENFSQNRQDQGIAHILQHGISVWDSLTEYQAGKSYVQGSDGLLYVAIQTHTNHNPVTDSTYVYWAQAARGGLLAVRLFTTSTTYTPTPGMKFAIVEVQGAGGGGGGATATGSGQVAVPGGGASGSYAKGNYTSATIGASVAITIGVGGAGGVAGVSGGAVGGTTSFGAIAAAPGGGGAASHGPVAPPVLKAGGVPGGVATGGNILNIRGTPGDSGLGLTDIYGGYGAGSALAGGGGGGIRAVANQAGFTATAPGGGGGGACSSNGAAFTGGAGANGAVLVWEYM